MENKMRKEACLVAVIISMAMLPRSIDAEPKWVTKQNEKHGGWTLGPIASIMPWYFRTGMRVGIPIAPSGFVPALNDEARIEIGADFQLFWARPWGGKCKSGQDDFVCEDLFFRLAVPGALRWEFYLTKMWSAYVLFGLEFGIPFNEHYRDPFGPHGWFWFVLDFGTRIKLKEHFALRLEIGTLGLLVFGIEFMF